VGGDTLHVYFTKIGDAPERILRSAIDLRAPLASWRASAAELVLFPETDWEGADLRIRKSVAGASRGREHAVRDPAIFIEGHRKYMLYSTAGESGIALVEFSPLQTG
jgi:hypothetical protein